MMNDFGNDGCFELLVQLLESEEFCKDINVKALMCISILISLPAVTYHKTFMEEYGGRINQAIKARLIGIQDKHVRDIKKAHVETLYKSLAALQLRTMEKAVSLKDLEIFKLNMCKKYLRSENLEPRIQGMRELKDIIDNNQSWSPNKQLTFQFLVEWMAENNVFELLWGKRTHQQIVERSNTIFKFLLDEGYMTLEYLQLVWDASGAYKPEVFKIITDYSYYLKQPHKEFICTKITEKSAADLDMSDFELLSEIGRFGQDDGFKNKLAEFFWRIVVSAEDCDEELLTSCIEKFTDMVKYWSIEQKKPFFDRFTAEIQNANDALPVIKLFKRLVSDEMGRQPAASSANNYPVEVQEYKPSVDTSNDSTVFGGLKWKILKLKLRNARFDLQGHWETLDMKEKRELLRLMKKEADDRIKPRTEAVAEMLQKAEEEEGESE